MKGDSRGGGGDEVRMSMTVSVSENNGMMISKTKRTEIPERRRDISLPLITRFCKQISGAE